MAFWLKTGMQGIILQVADDKNLLIYFIGDSKNRWMPLENYPNISIIPNIKISIIEEFMSTATINIDELMSTSEELYPPISLKTGQQGILIEANDDFLDCPSHLLIHIAGDVHNRWISKENYRYISVTPQQNPTDCTIIEDSIAVLPTPIQQICQLTDAIELS